MALASIARRVQKLVREGNALDCSEWVWAATNVLGGIYISRGKLLEGKSLLDATILDMNTSITSSFPMTEDKNTQRSTW